MDAERRGLGKPVRTALRWQALATAILGLIVFFWIGFHGAVSVVLGGMVNMLSGAIAALLATRRPANTAGGMLFAAARAEGVRVLLIVGLLWLVMATYREVVAPAFFGAFALTLLLFSSAFFVRDES